MTAQMETDHPVLSVLIPTYNHGRYIGECIQGVLMQEIDFTMEIIIGDDCSTDDTREVILREMEKNTDPLKRFRLLFHDHNLGTKEIPGKLNWMSCIEAATGDFIATCEGDDYWTDPLKIRKQMDYLKEHPECSGVFHPADRWIESSKELIKGGYHPEYIHEKYGHTEVFQQKGNPSPPCAQLYRNYRKPLPDWWVLVPFGDFAIMLENLKHGPYGYIDESMAVYRMHSTGSYTKESLYGNYRNELKLYAEAAEDLGLTGMTGFNDVLFSKYISLFSMARSDSKREAWGHFFNSLRHLSIRRQRMQFLKAVFPWLWRKILQAGYRSYLAKKWILNRFKSKPSS